jgi:cytochrome c oxidase subunit 2
VALVLGALGALAVWQGPSWFPVQAAAEAQRQDTLYLWLLVMSSFIFFLVIVFLVYSMWKFRARPGDESDGAPIHGHTGLEIIWTVLPIAIVLGFAVYGGVVLGRNETLKPGHLTVDVQGQQFAWTFTYPAYGNLKTGVLALPVGRQVDFRLSSVAHDVIHEFYIPAFRLGEDAVPGTGTSLSATPNRIGTYTVVCAELCGIGHSQMRTLVKVMSGHDFTAWIAAQQKAAKAPAGGGTTDAAALFSSTCGSCHTFTAAGASGTIGPNLDNLAADAAKYGGGESAAAYVRESITDPAKVVVSGYPDGIMPATFKSTLTSQQVDALVAYLLGKGG